MAKKLTCCYHAGFELNAANSTGCSGNSLLSGNEKFLDKELLTTHLYDFVDASVQETIIAGLLEEDIKKDLDILNK